MKKNNDRRSFLKKLAAATSVAIVSKTGISMETNKEEPLVKNSKPLGFQWETRDPFLFCVHHEDHYPKGNEKQGPAASLEGRNIGSDFIVKDGWRMYHGDVVPGFPGHPHRGFETVTVVKKGWVDHSDSLGATGRYGNGDVQWMTAGKGVQHAEMFPCVYDDKENPLELFQIWLNLPRKSKMVEPHYKMLWSEKIPIINTKDDNEKNVRLEIIAGKIGDKSAPTPPPNSWAFDKANDVAIWNIKLDPSATWELPLAQEGINRTLYFYEGEELLANDVAIKSYHSAELSPTGKIVLKAGESGANVLILQGKPIGEPVVQHGPFVMNTREEIQQTFSEYQKTQFGGWPWETYSPVNAKNSGRFAKYADGSEEKP